MGYLDPAGGALREGGAVEPVADLVAATGTADGTVADVGASFNQATLNNNFKDVSVKINEMLAALRAAGLMEE